MATNEHGKWATCLAAIYSSAKLKKYEFGHPETGRNDVVISIKYRGICHSDCCACDGDWGINKKYPMTPGHEISGIINKVGKDVKEFKVRDKVGIGRMYGS